MKKLFTVLMAVFICTFIITSCGESGSSGTTTAAGTAAASSQEAKAAAPETTAAPETIAPVEPLDLRGLWVQTDRSEDGYVAAEIRDDGKIGIFFWIKDDPTPWTYWVGTYIAPDTDSERYSWTSVNTYSGNGLLASTADSKDFTYENGIIEFPVTMQGKTGSVQLERGDWDNKAVPEDVYLSEKVSEEDKNAALSGEFLEITDSAWYVESEKWLKYCVTLRNTSEDTIIEFPSFRITARDKDGVLLGTEDQTLSVIYPGQDFVYGFQAFSVEEIPETVEFEPLPPADYNIKKLGSSKGFDPLTVVNDKLRSDKYVGEISNPNDFAIDNAVVVFVGKDANGDLVKIDVAFVDDVPANGTAAFEISLWGNKEIASYESYANQW